MTSHCETWKTAGEVHAEGGELAVGNYGFLELPTLTSQELSMALSALARKFQPSEPVSVETTGNVEVAEAA